ncbi:AAEL002147-PA [Aedes aegypti]|uniref:AAEL002147-PA n=1 Tax=Aedes aegypti TaxID=7159 RepID=Q17J44_AEDAE|nr:AAEL002147-PA [Aedes aegypti]
MTPKRIPIHITLTDCSSLAVVDVVQTSVKQERSVQLLIRLPIVVDFLGLFLRSVIRVYYHHQSSDFAYRLGLD